MAFLNRRFGLTQMTAWRIEVAPVPGLSNVASPQKLSSPSQSLYMDMGMVMMPKKGGPDRRCDGQEHREYKRDKACRCSRLVWPLGDRKRDMLKLHPAAASRSPTRTGSSSSLCRSVSSRSLGGERGQGLCQASTFYTTLVKKSQEANGASELRRTPLP